MREFIKERKMRVMQEELAKVCEKLQVPPELLDLYRQNPLLKQMLKKAIDANRS